MWQPEKVNMVIFRENTEDIYAGIEFMTGTPEAKKLLHFLVDELGVKAFRFPETTLSRRASFSNLFISINTL